MRIEDGEVDPSSIVTHTLKFDHAPGGYQRFRHTQDHRLTVVREP